MLAPGPLSTVQDRGRPGLGHLGIGRSGAADRRSLRRANELVGNAVDAAGIETTFGGLRVRFEVDAVVALTGARCVALAGDRPVPFGVAVAVPAGTALRLRTPGTGVRSYLAVDGGIEVPPVLGSRSTDTLAGLGPAPLTAGMSLPLGPPATRDPGLSTAPATGPTEDQVRAVPRVTLLPGPRRDWFTPAAIGLLYSTDWTVTPRADRVGIRLAGPALTRRIPGELPSEPMVEGAVQVPPDGQPILFLADHPVTGGYPVIGVVAAADLPVAAQLRPGGTFRFRPSGAQR